MMRACYHSIQSRIRI